MTREERKQALDWFSNRSKAVTMPGAKRMYLLAIEALSAEKRTEERTETHECDYISRQAAINEFKCCELTPDCGIDVNYAIEFLEQLPSAQPERTGHWTGSNYVGEEFGVFICSECGKASLQSTAYCCNCGCRMMEEDHGHR